VTDAITIQNPRNRDGSTGHVLAKRSVTFTEIRIEGYGQQFGVLQACWGYGSKHDGERYEVHLCEPCFFRTLAMLRRERMVNTMFDDDLDTNQDEFGLVRKDDFWAEG